MTRFESSLDEFRKRGVDLVVVAAQKIDGLFGAREFIKRKHYLFPLLFDEDRRVTRAYGVYHFLGLDALRIARPAAFVISREGKVCWIAVSPDQFERPRTEDLIDAIEACDRC